MPKFTRQEVLQKIHKYPIVPLLPSNNVGDCLKIIDACYKGGIRVFEFTNRGDFAQEIFVEMCKHIRKNCPDMAFGIGTIIDAGTASWYIQNGADFIVCPNLVAEVAHVCNLRKIAWIPGVATLSEISKAEELGAEIVKLFPAQIVGPDFIKAAKVPFPNMAIMATGGVEPNEESLKQWFDSEVTCVGLGSQLFPKSLFETQDFEPLTATCQNILKIAGRYKQ